MSGFLLIVVLTGPKILLLLVLSSFNTVGNTALGFSHAVTESVIGLFLDHVNDIIKLNLFTSLNF